MKAYSGIGYLICFMTQRTEFIRNKSKTEIIVLQASYGYRQFCDKNTDTCLRIAAI